MNATELMVGDYVIRKNVPKEILIVDTIDSIRDIVYLDLDGLGITEKIENIEPIPLTQKILGQNGFELQRDKSELGTLDTYWLGSELGAFRIHRLNNGDYQFGLAKIKYVHQLQHALRLCGIDKEIKV